MTFYKNMKAKVRSPDGASDLFDNVTGILQRDTLAKFLFIIFLDYVQQMLMKENGLTFLKKDKKRTIFHKT